MFAPVYIITPAIARALMSIEADRQAVADLPINVTVLAKLRESAKLISTHYSTQIEGNRLTQRQVKEALAGAHIPARSVTNWRLVITIARSKKLKSWRLQESHRLKG
jgi:Fic family protein